MIEYLDLGLIEILDQEKDEIIAKLESDLKTLETKNLELKYTNRNLISTVAEQKNKLKAFKSKITELESLKNPSGPKNFDELKKDYQNLIAENKDLKLKYEGSQRELAELRSLTSSETKSGSGLFGRFLKRSSNENPDDNADAAKEGSKNKNSSKK